MKKKLFKRLLGLVLITIISISIANPIGALAAGTSEAESKDISVSTKENQLVRGWYHPTLPLIYILNLTTMWVLLNGFMSVQYLKVPQGQYFYICMTKTES